MNTVNPFTNNAHLSHQAEDINTTSAINDLIDIDINNDDPIQQPPPDDLPSWFTAPRATGAFPTTPRHESTPSPTTSQSSTAVGSGGKMWNSIRSALSISSFSTKVNKTPERNSIADFSSIASRRKTLCEEVIEHSQLFPAVCREVQTSRLVWTMLGVCTAINIGFMSLWYALHAFPRVLRPGFGAFIVQNAPSLAICLMFIVFMLTYTLVGAYFHSKYVNGLRLSIQCPQTHYQHQSRQLSRMVYYSCLGSLLLSSLSAITTAIVIVLLPPRSAIQSCVMIGIIGLVCGVSQGVISAAYNTQSLSRLIDAFSDSHAMEMEGDLEHQISVFLSRRPFLFNLPGAYLFLSSLLLAVMWFLATILPFPQLQTVAFGLGFLGVFVSLLAWFLRHRPDLTDSQMTGNEMALGSIGKKAPLRYSSVGVNGAHVASVVLQWLRGCLSVKSTLFFLSFYCMLVPFQSVHLMLPTLLNQTFQLDNGITPISQAIIVIISFGISASIILLRRISSAHQLKAQSNGGVVVSQVFYFALSCLAVFMLIAILIALLSLLLGGYAIFAICVCQILVILSICWLSGWIFGHQITMDAELWRAEHLTFLLSPPQRRDSSISVNLMDNDESMAAVEQEKIVIDQSLAKMFTLKASLLFYLKTMALAVAGLMTCFLFTLSERLTAAQHVYSRTAINTGSRFDEPRGNLNIALALVCFHLLVYLLFIWLLSRNTRNSLRVNLRRAEMRRARDAHRLQEQKSNSWAAFTS